MSNIVQALRRLAATARHVSMENTADPTVQGQESNLDEAELKDVADKAAADVGDETTDTAAEGGATEEVGGEIPGGDLDAATAEPVAGEEGTDPAAADGAEPPTDPAAAEPTADEIQTPAEAEFEQTTGEQTETDPTDPEANAEAAGEPAAAEGEVAEDGQLPPMDETADVPADAAVDAAAPVEGAPPAEGELGALDAPIPGDEPAAGDTPDPTAEVPVAAPTAPADAVVPEVADAPQTDAAAPAEAEPAPAPVTTPEAIEKSEAVMEVVELTEAAAEASSAEEVLQQSRGIEDGLTELADTAAAVNESGGVDMQSYAMLSLAAKTLTSQLDRKPLNFGVALESLADGKRARVSLEDIEELIGEMQLIQPDLEREALKSLDRQVCSLKDALPAARDRVRAVVARAKAKSMENGGQIDLDPNLAAALTIDGAMPEDLSDGLFDYIELGKSLLNGYTPAAFRAATEASLLINSVEFNSVEGFWEQIGKRIDNVKDPRQLIPASLLQTCMPGGAGLFSEMGAASEAAHPVATRLYEYADGLVPLEATVAIRAAEGAGNSSYAALTNSKITSIGEGLLTVLDMDKICELLEQGGKLWPDAKGAITQLREVLNGAPQDIANIAGGDFPQLVKFLETNYSLATWPLLNYLTNMVFTANAFVLLSELSLKAVEVAPEPVVEEVAPIAADAAVEPVVDDTAAATDDVVATGDEMPPIPDETTETDTAAEPELDPTLDPEAETTEEDELPPA